MVTDHQAQLDPLDCLDQSVFLAKEELMENVVLKDVLVELDNLDPKVLPECKDQSVHAEFPEFQDYLDQLGEHTRKKI